jgi:hypothetical protein
VRDHKTSDLTALWDAPDGSPCRLTFTVKRIGGRLELVGFELRSLSDRPVRAAWLRTLKLEAEFEQAREAELSRDERLIDLGLEREAQRVRRTPEDLERVVHVYRELWRDGSTAPTRDTAKALGLRYHQVAKMIQRCRREGLLPTTQKGIARGATEAEQ